MLGALDLGLVLGEALPHWGDNVKLQGLCAGPKDGAGSPALGHVQGRLRWEPDGKGGG